MLGIDDEEFIRGEVPMTKQEIRILTLAKARINSDSVVADVGAGTGSISIEAAKLLRGKKIFHAEIFYKILCETCVSLRSLLLCRSGVQFLKR